MEEFLMELIEEQTIYELILLHADKVCRVKSFLLTIMIRRRFLKKKRSINFIKAYYRLHRVRKLKRLEAEKIRDDQQIKKMQEHLIRLRN